MKTAELLPKVAERLMRCPAAPYHENGTATAVREICEDYALPIESDRFGNLLVGLNRAGKVRPLVLAAHLDHPAFVIQKRLRAGVWLAEFLGGVGDSYFREGIPLQLEPGGAKAKLGKRTSKTQRLFEVHGRTDAKVSFAVWDLPAFVSAKGKISGRACDDLIGAASILATLIALRSSKVNVIGVFSRAEEVGFQGALALAGSKRLPGNSLIVSLETSRELAPVKMGEGVIIRVGDRASIFSSGASRFLAEVATDLRKRDEEFKFQRALMSGGTCEATAYQERGYECAAVCVALGNYHNCGASERIRAEFVSAFDAASMTTLLIECAKAMPRYDELAGRLLKRLKKLEAEGVRKLAKTPLNPGRAG